MQILYNKSKPVYNPSIMAGYLHTVVTLLLLIGDISCKNTSSNLILISMDSLMYKFIENAPFNGTENFQYIIRNGVLLKELMNVLPSATYPNHYSILTGLYPESHGIVGNRFYDPYTKSYFDYGSLESNIDSKWYDVGAEPIYVTNTKAGGGRRSGSLLFPTGLATVKGVAPDVVLENDANNTYINLINGTLYINMSFTDRIDKLISWFTDTTQPINLGLLHLPEPDAVAHAYGPDSEEVQREITGPLNNVLGYLIQKLQDAKLMNRTNILITADHGHILRKRFIYLDDYVDPDVYITSGGDNVVTEIWPTTGYEDALIRNLTYIRGIRVYKKWEPELRAMNYSNNPRIAPIVLIADLGVLIVKNKTEEDGYASVIGVHGYDPVRYPSMRPVFMAMGPAFKKNTVSTKLFGILDLYPLMCHLLDLDPAPNNGSLDNVRHLLTEETEENNGQCQITMPLILLLGDILAVFLFI